MAVGTLALLERGDAFVLDDVQHMREVPTPQRVSGFERRFENLEELFGALDGVFGAFDLDPVFPRGRLDPERLFERVQRLGIVVQQLLHETGAFEVKSF